MSIKREYWVNLNTKRKFPGRNNTHIRLAGETVTLCSRHLNPELDEEQTPYWKQVEKPNARKVCAQCKKISKRLGNGRDEAIKNAQVMVTDRDELKEDVALAELMTSEMTDKENLAYDVKEVIIKASEGLRDMLSELESCSDQKSLNLFMKVNAFKKFIEAGEVLLDD